MHKENKKDKKDKKKKNYKSEMPYDSDMDLL